MGTGGASRPNAGDTAPPFSDSSDGPVDIAAKAVRDSVLGRLIDKEYLPAETQSGTISQEETPLATSPHAPAATPLSGDRRSPGRPPPSSGGIGPAERRVRSDLPPDLVAPSVDSSARFSADCEFRSQNEV